MLLSNKMSGGKDRKAACSVFVWLKRKHPSFANDIEEGLCVSPGLFRPKRTFNGLTFLLPDKETRDKISADSYGTAKEVKNATELLKSLILPDRFNSGTDFKNREVGNINGGVFEISSATSAAVTFKSGATAKKVSVEMIEDGISIWELTGTPKANGDTYRPRKKDTSGGAAVTAGSSYDDEICRIWDNATTALLEKKSDNGYNPLLVYLIAIMDNLKRKHHSHYEMGLTLLNRNPLVALYGLLMPAFTRDDLRLIPCSIIMDCIRIGPQDSSLDSDFHVRPEAWTSYFQEACDLGKSTLDLIGGKVIDKLKNRNLDYPSYIALNYDEVYFTICMSMSHANDYEGAIAKTNAIIGMVRNLGEKGCSVLTASAIPTSVDARIVEKFKHTEAYKRQPNQRDENPDFNTLKDIDHLPEEGREQLAFPVDAYISF